MMATRPNKRKKSISISPPPPISQNLDILTSVPAQINALHYVEAVRNYHPLKIQHPTSVLKHLDLSNSLANLLIRTHGKGDVGAVAFRLLGEGVKLYYSKNEGCSIADVDYVTELVDFTRQMCSREHQQQRSERLKSSRYDSMYLLSIIIPYCKEKIIHRIRQVYKTIERIYTDDKNGTWCKEDNTFQEILQQQLEDIPLRADMSLGEMIRSSFNKFQSLGKQDPDENFVPPLILADLLANSIEDHDDGVEFLSTVFEDEILQRRLKKLGDYRSTTRKLVSLSRSGDYAAILAKMVAINVSLPLLIFSTYIFPFLLLLCVSC